MNNACEYMLYAKKNGINMNDITFIPAKVFSPYVECLSTDKNQIEVNPYFRYKEIFSQLLSAENEGILQELKDFLFDFWIHEVYEIECLAGMTGKAFAKARFISEIAEGLFGEKVRKDFMLFSEEEQDALMNQVLKLYSGGEGRSLFCNAMKLIFSQIYIYVLNHQKILLYIGEKETSVTKKKINFIKDIFLPIGSEMDIFWNRHFGVFGVEETMILDEMVLI